MTKIFTGGIITETNTFAPYPTALDAFEELLLLRAGEALDPVDPGDPCAIFIERSREEGWEVAAGLRTFAQPAGPVVQAVYEKLRDELLSDLVQAMPVDGVLLSLHGAMIAEGQDDGEGDILERVRAEIGPDVPIGVHLDPHCHLTPKMVENADVLRIWKEYPHTDIAERAGEVFDLIKARIAGAPRAIPVVHDCRMTQMFHTTRQPMRGFVDRVSGLEGRDGIQTISIAHSFPWGDTADMGTKVLVYAADEASIAKAEELARKLGEELWNMREAVGTPYLNLEESLDRAFNGSSGLVVISDGPDNPGGGAPCDSTYFLARLLERGDRDWAVGYIYDPLAVRIATGVGLGAKVRLRVGGKTCALSGQPVDLEGSVCGVVMDAMQSLANLAMPAGNAVGIDLGDNRHIVLISRRVQTFTYALFEDLGIDLSIKRAIIVKSSQHFYASFSEISDEILYAAPPGVVSPDLDTLPYEKVDQSIWPLTTSS